MWKKSKKNRFWLVVCLTLSKVKVSNNSSSYSEICQIFTHIDNKSAGCCTLVVVEERPPPHDCKALWVYSRGLHGSQNSYPNPKRPVNMLHGTDPDPYFIWKWDPNPCRPEKCLKCTTRTRRGPDHYSKVGTEPGWEDTDPTAPKKKNWLKLLT